MDVPINKHYLENGDFPSNFYPVLIKGRLEGTAFECFHIGYCWNNSWWVSNPGDDLREEIPQIFNVSEWWDLPYHQEGCDYVI